MTGYNKKELYKKAIKAIKEKKLFFIEDIVAFMPCRKSTFYKHFVAGSDEMNEFKELLEDNKVDAKVSIRQKLSESSKAGELLALYRLIGTSEERRLLNQQYIEMTGKDGKDLTPQIQIEVVGGIKDAETSSN